MCSHIALQTLLKTTKTVELDNPKVLAVFSFFPRQPNSRVSELHVLVFRLQLEFAFWLTAVISVSHNEKKVALDILKFSFHSSGGTTLLTKLFHHDCVLPGLIQNLFARRCCRYFLGLLMTSWLGELT